ncbi:CzcA family heavy metal efflux pump/hydrophobe/amphiphile efflux-1 (HAE1) family protein [Pontibacter ummariensis]|uniref:Heavy metal efflux pump, CzcA family/hydrophobe/amphiphile efflux-1 (HAE1) family protein n=1 Tax=Pontibacter ummariensis TaxID=1610492 RepID=A0A239GII6_9BACT|nr:efflux RND transporter permease subunit [Pontibacter ummariensis]PRY11288.1 CzcA family heavy metal efflux pump/hydrophobe/amphiphile efflux-1 (HAE1) family protein [Pontibacter ummariensis]SNS68959.1 heavy metal efflux pump, CzcA family/hydrophobe/amphiphile efflux-1 (HAE1) family protein [Pontibacter ummariensis]
MNITKLSIQRSTLVVVVFTVLTLLGVVSYQSLNYELLPKFSPPVLTVSTIYPGASPNEVENSVTKEIEDALSSLENVKEMKSTSLESFSIITIQLNQGTDVDLSLQDAQRKINTILAKLPEDADAPTLNKFDFDDLPIIKMGATANLSATEFYDLIDKKIKPELSRVPGMAAIKILGGQEREIKVNIDANKLEAYNLSILQVQQKIRNSNLDFPTGKIKQESGQTQIRLAGKFQSLDQLRNLIIREDQNGIVRLGDVAEVQDTQKDVEVLTRVNATPSVGITIQKQSDANAVEVSRLTKEALAKLEQTYAAEGLKFNIANDSSDFTLDAADSVIHDLVIAVFLVAAVMLLFLHSLRNAVIVMISIPASLVATFIAMYLFGFSLNLMSLLALSLVVGILVDDAIVVIENIHRHMEMGKKPAQAAYDGIREIMATVTSITLVIVVVFIPIALSSGLVSDILRQFAVVVAVATMISLFVAFTLIPLLASRFSRLEHISDKNVFGRFILAFERFLDRIIDGFTAALKWAFNHKFITLGVTLLMLVASFMLVPFGFIGSEFIPSGDRGEVSLQLELPKNATVEQTNFATKQVEEYLQAIPEVEKVFTTVGTTSSAQAGQNTAYKADVSVTLVDVKERSFSTDQFSRQAKADIESKLPDVEVTPVPVGLVGTAQAPIQIIISGSNLDSVMTFAEKVMEITENVNGTVDVETSVEGGNPEIEVVVDRDKMASVGLSLENVGASMQLAFSGNSDVTFRSGTEDYDINIRLDEFDRRSVTDIGNLTFVNNKGQLVRLAQFADIRQATGPSQLERYNRVTSVNVNAFVIGRPSGSIGADIQAQLAEVDMPKGVSVEFGGDLKNQSEGFGTLGIALLASIIFVYLIMVALYDSYVYPLVVLFSIPLAIIGALLALALAAQSLSIFSILGIIMMIGLVAKNAIMVVDFTNNMKAEGAPVKEALIEAVRIRFRPILMTTLAMVIGMLPIALAGGSVAATKNGLALALIGGLTSSMFLTLIVVPVIYYGFDRILAKFGLDKKTVIELEDKTMEELEHETAELEGKKMAHA